MEKYRYPPDRADDMAWNAFLEDNDVNKIFDELERKLEDKLALYDPDNFPELTAPLPIPAIYVSYSLKDISMGIFYLCLTAAHIAASPELYTLFEDDEKEAGYDKALKEAKEFVEEALKLALGLYVLPESVKRAILIADAYVSGEEKGSWEELKKSYGFE